MLVCACAKHFDLTTNAGRGAWNTHLCWDGKPPRYILLALRD